MTWICHHQRPRALPTGVSVSKNGVVRLSDELSSVHGLKHGSKIYLMFDPESHSWGLRLPTTADAPGAATLTNYARGLHCSAREFVAKHAIKPGRYRTQYDDASGVLVCTPQESI